MKALGKIFLQGLLTVLPIALTVYILYWLGSWAELSLGGLLQLILPEDLYWPGMGLLMGVGLVFVLGLLLQTWLIRKLFSWGESLLNRIPVVRSFYGPMRDVMAFFSNPEGRGLGRVVMVTLDNGNVRLLGFLTREAFDDLPEGVGSSETVAVYLPMSYQLGGFTTVVPRSMVRPIEMSLEDGIRFALTAGMPPERRTDS